MDKEMLELYSDYIISSFGFVTATGLSEMLNGGICHDKTTKFLNNQLYTSKELWELVKPTIRKIESENDVLVADDTIQEKQYTDENDIVSWHWDHAKGRNVKGINMLSLLLVSSKEDMNIPVNYHIIEKTERFIDEKTGKEKRRSKSNKNEILRDMIGATIRNRIKFKYFLADSWYCSKENMQYILSRRKHFIMEIKDNRLVALSLQDKLEGKFHSIESLNLVPGKVYQVYIKGLDRTVSLCRQVFKNKDESTGERYLVCSDTTIDFDSITTIYKKRWKVEESYKSMKCNTGFAKSPTKVEKSQSNHFFSSIYSYFKLQLLSCKTNLNNFALKTKLYYKALKSSYEELQMLKSSVSM